MKRNIKSLIGFTLSATDGEFGKVKEFYFDDVTWTIRYLVVDTGNWFAGRVVLISPEALLSPDWNNKTFPVNLTKDQIKHSPDINSDRPVSRQEEIKLHSYYSWVAYWGSAYYRMGPTNGLNQEILRNSAENEDKQLRSTHLITGYSIKATDGKIGELEDFLMNEDNWKIDFILVDVGHWFSGKKVLLPPNLIKEIDWESASVIVEATVAHVKNSPEYDPDHELTQVYILAHHDHYRQI